MTILNRDVLSQAAKKPLNYHALYKKAPLVVAMWALSHGAPLLAQDFTPTKFTDYTGAGDGSLRDAIIKANADNVTQDDRILLAAGTYTLSVAGRAAGALQGDLNITRAASSGTVTIEGAGPGLTIIDAAGIDRAFNLSSTKVVFKNLTIRNGSAQDAGVFTAPLSLSRTAGFSEGGAILANASTVTLDTVVLENNVAQGFNGVNGITGSTNNGSSGQSAFGGAIYTQSGTLTIVNSTLRNNQVKGGVGGNGANSNSGSGYLAGSGAAAQGGGIFSVSTTISVSGSTINGNIAAGGVGGAGGNGFIGGLSYGGNGGNGGAAGSAVAGGIYAYGGSITLTNSTLSGNQAAGGAGGAGGNAGTGTSVIPTSNNGGNAGTAGTATGGGISILFGTTSAVISNVTIASNSATGGAGAAGGISNSGHANGTSTAAGAATGGGLNSTVAATVTSVVSTLFAGNTAATGPDSNGPVTSQGFNLLSNSTGSTGFTVASDIINVDPKIDTLKDNGGPTFTHALLTGSPALDKGSAGALTTDQRGPGFPRVQYAAADIGAFEFVFQNPPPVNSVTAAPSPAITTQTVQFSATGTGNFTWDFGDGTTGTGATPSHQYAAPGTYTVTVTLTDPNTGLKSSQTLQVTVTGIAFRVKKADLKLVTGKDSIKIIGVLHVPPDLAIAGQTIVLSFGANTQTFVLNDKGVGKSGANTFALNRKDKSLPEEADFTAHFTGDLLAGLIASATVDSAGLPTSVTVTVKFNSGTYQATIPVKFKKSVAHFIFGKLAK